MGHTIMLQVDFKTYASDALEDAMRLAQTKALNSYSWSDMLNYLNYAWSDCYNRIACIDEGYYSVTVRLNTVMTKLPAFVKNTIRVYAAQDIVGFNRQIFRASGQNDLTAQNTYHISGFDLYCPDAIRRTVWLNFVPIAPMLFFPRNNRDPKLTNLYVYSNPQNETLSVPAPNFTSTLDYGMYKITFGNRSTTRPTSYDNETVFNNSKDMYFIQMLATHKATSKSIDITSRLIEAVGADDWRLARVITDYPYVFVTFHHRYKTVQYATSQSNVTPVTGPVCKSGFFKNIIDFEEFIEYNPFDFTGRESNVEYIKARYNDKTGMGVEVIDWNDYDIKEQGWHGKELGFTPDSLLVYPCPEMYRYVVARLAEKFSAMNESNVMGVQKELVEAKYAFEAFCARDKSAWGRIDNVNGPYITDWL